MSLKIGSRLPVLVSLLMGIGSLSACSHAKPASDALHPDDSSSALGDSDSGHAQGLETVHFDYDSYSLTAEQKGVLKQNAEILKSHPSLKIQVEGNCDQRGGIQYNLALGEKRAKAAKHFLVDQGIKSSRITTISYGKERLLDPAETEEAYAKNRRANFAISSM